MPVTMKVIGYTRVSTNEQADSGLSLEAQQEKIELYCKLHGLQLLRVISDPGHSGKTLDRPGMQEVLHLLKIGTVQGVVVAKLDRLTRSLRDFHYLIDHWFGEDVGKPRKLFSVSESINTTTAMGRMVLSLVMMIAQWEREIIVERVKEALTQKRRRGERCGAVRYGYRLAEETVIDRHTKLPKRYKLEPEPREQEAIAFMRAARFQGSTWRQIAEALTLQGYAPRGNAQTRRQAGAWDPASVRGIVLRAIRDDREQELAKLK